MEYENSDEARTTSSNKGNFRVKNLNPLPCTFLYIIFTYSCDSGGEGIAAFLTSLRPCRKLILYLVSYYYRKITNAQNCITFTELASTPTPKTESLSKHATIEEDDVCIKSWTYNQGVLTNVTQKQKRSTRFLPNL